MSRTTRRYGCWPSAIGSDYVAAAGRKFADLSVDPAAPDTLYWVETRPDEGGRCTLVRQSPGGACETLLDAPWSARSSVHEYGGAVFAVHGGVLWFVNAQDQAIYQRATDGGITRVTLPHESARYADLQYDSCHQQLIAVAETPRADDEPQASIVRISGDGECQTVAAGHDFYASPRLSPDTERLVWLAWNHPDMPWDSTELWQACITADGRMDEPECVHAGREESLFGPLFDHGGRLHVVSDVDDWWNIQRQDDSGVLRPLTHEAAEFGLPQWVFGQKTCVFDADNRLFGLSTAQGLWQLGQVDAITGDYKPLALEATHMEQLVATADGLALVVADASTPRRIVRVTQPESAAGPQVDIVCADGGPAGCNGVVASRARGLSDGRW